MRASSRRNRKLKKNFQFHFGKSEIYQKFLYIRAYASMRIRISCHQISNQFYGWSGPTEK